MATGRIATRGVRRIARDVLFSSRGVAGPGRGLQTLFGPLGGKSDRELCEELYYAEWHVADDGPGMRMGFCTKRPHRER